MSTEANKALVYRLFEEGLNKNNSRVIDELVGPNYVNHNFPAPAPGAEGFKQVIGMFQTAFPDMQVTVEDAVAEGDKVATRGYFTGRHHGAFMGIPATDMPIKVAYSDVWRIENGKLVENWVQMDLLGMMQQLGVIPTPG
jgi:predicted ester cyclase